MSARHQVTQAAARRGERRSVVDDIKQYIVEAGLVPGDPLPSEAALCEELAVSRPRLREALRTLQSLDIVAIQHGRGMRVGGLSLSPMVEALLFRARLAVDDPLRPVREVLDLRERMDMSVAAELPTAVDRARRDELSGLVSTMQRHHAAHESFAAEDRAFHTVLLGALENHLFVQVNSAFWQIHTEALPLLGIPPAQDLADTIDAHQAMLDAIGTGDVQAYERAVVAHYRPLRRQVEAASDAS